METEREREIEREREREREIGLEDFPTENGSNQGHDFTSTGLFVPGSLDSG
jgi:hypothetical protein